MKKHYRELRVWQEAMALVTAVYEATSIFPIEERFGLTTQIRRSAVSVPSNIAEGYGRMTVGERLQFLGHSRGSLNELETEVEIAVNLEFLRNAAHAGLSERIARVGRSLNALIRHVRRERT